MTRLPAASATLFLAFAMLAGCRDQPKRGEIPKAPEGFLFDANAVAARHVLPDRELLDQDGWLTTREPGSSIMISEYSGTTSAGEVEAARAAAARRYTYAQYSELEEVTIDGRASWGWIETQRRDGRTCALDYVAVIPYEDKTYTVEFGSAETRFLNPAALRELVETFRVR